MSELADRSGKKNTQSAAQRGKSASQVPVRKKREGEGGKGEKRGEKKRRKNRKREREENVFQILF